MFFGRRGGLAASVFPVSGDREILAWVERRAVPAPEGCVASGTVSPSAAFPSAGLGGLVGKAGSEAVIENCASGTVTADYGFAAKELPAAAKKDSYTARFVADGVTVATVGYHPGDRALQEPSVPARAGYTGFWSRYALGEADITVQAVYRPLRASGGERLSSGVYDLAYGAAGPLTVAAGSSVTLSGEGEDLTLTVEAGAQLTLDGLRLRGDTTLLTLGEGCTLCLLGDNSLEVVSDLRSNEAPTLRFAGSLTVTGSGFLADSAGVGTVLLTGQRITFRGTPVSMEVYNVDGSNYFKLRDVAALLSGTGSGFSLSFDTELRAVLARRGESYTLVGGELQPGKDQASTAVPSRWLLYVDGALQPCDAVNVGGSNYFKLRDLGTSLGFRVDYDQETRTVMIEP